jgi:hypothetical protein
MHTHTHTHTHTHKLHMPTADSHYTCKYKAKMHLVYMHAGLARAMHTYTVYTRNFCQGSHQIYGHTRCIYTIVANPTCTFRKCSCRERHMHRGITLLVSNPYPYKKLLSKIHAYKCLPFIRYSVHKRNVVAHAHTRTNMGTNIHWHMHACIPHLTSLAHSDTELRVEAPSGATEGV